MAASPDVIPSGGSKRRCSSSTATLVICSPPSSTTAAVTTSVVRRGDVAQLGRRLSGKTREEIHDSSTVHTKHKASTRAAVLPTKELNAPGPTEMLRVRTDRVHERSKSVRPVDRQADALEVGSHRSTTGGEDESRIVPDLIERRSHDADVFAGTWGRRRPGDPPRQGDRGAGRDRGAAAGGGDRRRRGAPEQVALAAVASHGRQARVRMLHRCPCSRWVR
jgi:hypothetical protein